MVQPFKSVGVEIEDRWGVRYSIEDATRRLHIIVDLLIDDPQELVEMGSRRFLSMAAAIRQAKANLMREQADAA